MTAIIVIYIVISFVVIAGTLFYEAATQVSLDLYDIVMTVVAGVFWPIFIISIIISKGITHD